MNTNKNVLSEASRSYIRELAEMDKNFEIYDVFIASSKFNSIGANEKNVKKFYTSALFFKRNDQVRLNLVKIFGSLEDFGFYHLVLLSVINDIYTP